MSAGRIVLGAAIVMATGAILGVLFAPDKGSNTRKKLSKQGTRYVDAVKNTAGEYVETLGETFESAKETAVGIADKVKGAVDSIAGNEPQKLTRRA
jgi:gas vesicle protein